MRSKADETLVIVSRNINLSLDSEVVTIIMLQRNNATIVTLQRNNAKNN